MVWEPWNPVDDPARLYGAASGLPGTQRIVKCTECAMIYESPRYAADVIFAGYEHAGNDGHDTQYPMRVGSFQRALESLGTRIPPKGARVLDVGTAGGAFVEAARRHGYDSVGLEPSRVLVDLAKSRGLNVVQGSLEAHPFEPGSFDMVCLWDVIEHLPDPASALRILRSLLKPDGILLINYPDIGTWAAKAAGKRFWWVLSVHLHHFSRQTVREICRRTGYEVVHIQPYWQTLQFGYLEDMAVHFKMPLSNLARRLTPDAIKRLPMPYWASQTTVLARLAP